MIFFTIFTTRMSISFCRKTCLHCSNAVCVTTNKQTDCDIIDNSGELIIGVGGTVFRSDRQ